jgi:hypothetical protein
LKKDVSQVFGLFFDSSKIKKGRQSLPNRLMFMRTITYPWNVPGSLMTDDLVRIKLKETFFQYLTSETNTENYSNQIETTSFYLTSESNTENCTIAPQKIDL